MFAWPLKALHVVLVRKPAIAITLYYFHHQSVQIKVFLKPLEGAVVLTFGAGNGPDKDDDILEAFTHASKTTLMLNITQCLKGRVADAYATGTVSN